MTNRWLRLFKHRRFDEADVARLLGPGALDRLGARITASEAQHGGEVRLCIEAGLPFSYLRRGASARERAIAVFGKLRVWDTEHNNGVLVYLLMAEQAIEIVADRGLAQRVDDAEWQRITRTMQAAFQARRFEDGLDQALEAVTELLVRHFPRTDAIARRNELPDLPAVL